MKGNKPSRVKDVVNDSDRYYNSLEPDMRAFIDEYQDLRDTKLFLTSGRRNSEDKIGTYSKTSLHNTGNAFDIKSLHTDDYYFLMNDKKGLELMNKYSLGIIDETEPETMKKTGATGAHFHIGKDKTYAELTKNRLDVLNSGEKLPEVYSYKGWIDAGKDSKLFTKGHYVGDGHNHSDDNLQQSLGISNVPYQWNNSDIDLWNARETEKSIIKELKLEEDKDRQELVKQQEEVNNKINQANSFLQAFTNRDNTDIDPLAEIQGSQSNSQQLVQGYDYQVPLQDYNPNRFIYTT